MIFTERTIKIKNGVASIDSPIVLYRGDREVEVLFTIVDSKFKFSSEKGNYIKTVDASYGQLAIDCPDGSDVFTEVAPCVEGSVTFKITGEMIDELYEVGFYAFHIRLFNSDQTSRITIPPIMEGIEIREPIVIEDDVQATDVVGDATVGYSIIQDRGAEEPVFDEEGNYIPTVWNVGDKITAERLNKIEEGIIASFNDTDNNDTDNNDNGSIAIPEYLNAEIDSIIDSLRDIQKKNTVSFAFMTDTHAKYNLLKNALLSINEINHRKKIDFICFGGDYITNNSSTTFDYANQQLETTREYIQKYNSLDNIMLIGNHDDNSMGAYDDVLKPDEYAQSLWHHGRSFLDSIGENMYGFRDDTRNKIRYIFLNALDIPYIEDVDGTPKYRGQWAYAICNEQLNWFANSLKLEEGWNIIVFSHIPLVQDISSDYIKNGDIIIELLQARKNKLLYNKEESRRHSFYDGIDNGYTAYDTPISIYADYREQPDYNCICCIHGHVHKDAITVTNGITHISTVNMGKSETSGNINELAYDIFTINKELKKCDIIRFGYGNDREFYYEQELEQKQLIATYSASTTGVTPSFNSLYSYSLDEVEQDGKYITNIYAEEDFETCLFRDLTSLLSVEYLKVTDKCTNLANIFRDCNNLTSVNTQGWNCASATSLENAFKGCSKIKQLDFTGCNVQNVGSLYSVFTGCSNLTTIIGLKDFNVSNVKGFQYMFNDCLKLVEIDIDGWNMSSALKLSYMFNNCRVLSSIIGIDTFVCSSVTDTQNMFNNCTLLEEIDIGNFNANDIDTTTNMFNGCNNLKTLDISSWMNVEDVQSAINSLPVGDGTNIIKTALNITMPEGWHSI